MVLGFSGIVPNAVIGLISIVMIVFGAEKVVEKMEGVAKYYDVSEVVIAMTIVSVGTSLPEIALHMVGSFNILADPGNIAKFQTISATVLGSNIGSDVVQQTLVLGLVVMSAAFMHNSRNFRFSRKFLIRDYAPMMGTTLMTLILAWDGLLSRLDGVILFGSFVAYMYYLYTTRGEKLERQGSAKPSTRPRYDLVAGVLFMILVIYSAEIFLRVVELGIQATGLSGSMIGVATIGIISAMPEMVTAISGLRQGAEGLSLGTLIGSNITNPLLAIGAGSIVSTYAVPRPLVLWDLPMETATAAFLLVYLLNKDKIGNAIAPLFGALGMARIQQRFENTENQVLTMAGAFLLVLLYVFYMYVRWTYFKVDFLI